MKNDMPSALVLLKEWSVWLVSLQTGALGVATFIVGKSENFRLNTFWLKLAMALFAGSIIFATFVLAALPDIALRIPHDDRSTNFYDMPIFNQPGYSVFAHTPLWIYTTGQHWLFMFGLVFVVLAIIMGRKRSTPR